VAALRGSVNCPPEAEPGYGGRKRSPVCGLPLVRFPSPSEVWVCRVAPYWLRALPPRRSERPRGIPRHICSRYFRSGSPLVEFRSSSEFRRLPAARPPSPCTPRERSERSRVRDPPLLGFLLLEHHDLGRPVRRETRLVSVSRGRRGLPHPRRCRPQGWFPLDGSGCFANRSSPVRSPPIFRDAPKLRGPVSCRSRPWSLPSELSPLGEPCPLSRVVASLRVRVRRPPARPGQALHNAFAFAPTLCHGLPRGLTGRPGHDVGFPRC
jgi:hypothetical protein